MDANGTRYHLLLGHDDWARCLDDQGRPLGATWGGTLPDPAPLQWDQERNELILAPRLFLYVASPGDTTPYPEDRRGAACDRYGNWYWIDASRRKVRVFSSGSRLATDFWPLEPTAPPPSRPGSFQPEKRAPAPAAPTFGGLTVTEDHYLVVGLVDPPGLSVFDLYGGGAPIQYHWPAEIPFVPFDMAPMPGGGVWILDREHKRYWAIDRHFDILADGQALQPPAGDAQPEMFQTVGLSGRDPRRMRPQASFPTGIDLEASVPLDSNDPIAIEALPDCTVLILDRCPGANFSEIVRYRYGACLGDPVSTQGMQAYIESDRQAGFTLVAHDFAFVPAHAGPDGPVLDRLYVASSNGNQAFAFNIDGDETHLYLSPLAEEYLPMRLFSGKALVAAGGQVSYDMGERWLPLVKQAHPRYAPEAFFFHQFDSRQPGCVWHRLMLDACIPPDTQVQVWSRAADEEDDLKAAAWQLERYYRRGDGSELSFVPDPFLPATEDSGEVQIVPRRDTAAGAGTWELLFQRAGGRYLQLRLLLSGQGQRSPRLRAMRIYSPRFSYLQHYLPAVYRADTESASFLERYLANSEGFYTALEDKVVGVRQLFDFSTAPPEALDWLANWFGVALDPGWSEYRRRLFIRNAMLFFQYRGTVRGLRMALRLALDACPGEHIFSEDCCGEGRDGTIRIIEMFLTRRLPAVLLGDPTDLIQPVSVTDKAMAWNPADGRTMLEYRYQEATGTIDPYPVQDPGGDQSQAWSTFSLENLGFIPASGPGDLLLWQAYLLHTYGAIECYNQAYKLTGDQQLSSFDEASLPEALPENGGPMDDWFRFETSFLPMVRYAHQFSVLLPMPGGAGAGSPVYEQRLSLARKVVDLEKPAHTTYNIKFFWAMFRVGAARLGLDTLLDLGGRSAQLLPPLVLGQSYLAQGIIGDNHPQDLAGRLVLERGCGPNFLPERTGAVRQVVIRNRPSSSGCTGCP